MPLRQEVSETRRAIIREWDGWARINPADSKSAAGCMLFLSISNKINQSYSISIRLAISGKRYTADCSERAVQRLGAEIVCG
jgi:hypothetical protein